MCDDDTPETDPALADLYFGRSAPPRTPECPANEVLFDLALGQPVPHEVAVHVGAGCAFCAAQLAVYGRWPAPADSAGSAYAGLGLTRLARSQKPADREQLLAKLRDWLPWLFPGLGLDEQWVADFLRTLADRPPLADDQRLRDVLPVWLAEFLGLPTGSLTIDEAAVGRAAVLRVVSRAEPGESELAKSFRAFVLTAPPTGPGALERLAFPATLRADLAFKPYLRAVTKEARARYREGVEVFELAAA